MADLYNRIAVSNCPGQTDQRKMMTAAETLFSQLRGIVGNTNFAHLFGLKGLLSQQFNRSRYTKNTVYTVYLHMDRDKVYS